RPLARGIREPMKRAHAMPFGAQVLPGGGVHFRLWAPDARQVALVLLQDGDRAVRELSAQPGGWHEHIELSAGPGTRYLYRIDDDIDVPDPASRRNPEGVHAASEVV